MRPTVSIPVIFTVASRNFPKLKVGDARSMLHLLTAAVCLAAGINTITGVLREKIS